MAVPTTITDLSATIASNVPAGSDQAFPYLDDYLRAAYGFIRQGDTKAANVASASTVDLGAVVGRFVDVTGTTTITSFGTVAAGIWRVVTFTGALTLTHNATSLILPGAANITTAAGDSLVAESLGSGNWKVVAYTRANGYPVAPTLAAGTYTPTLTSVAGVTSTTAYSTIYTRLGNTVTVYGPLDITPSANAVQIGISLPIPSGFTSSNDLSGVATTNINTFTNLRIYADATNDRAMFDGYFSTSGAAHPVYFTFAYLVV